ncbi:hypothetical protein DDW44_23470 [Streptomyces tirandamycinicus]|uniref:Uncharacterized protein n=1 Tax=Streptomyces tirandamycinicus TaxID=2174846 RepID=A0A2S1SYD8_9ACTN|nr:hypothetical protein DDW44_23470 [Streptomyces tirandamycinicus]
MRLQMVDDQLPQPSRGEPLPLARQDDRFRQGRLPSSACLRGRDTFVARVVAGVLVGRAVLTVVVTLAVVGVRERCAVRNLCGRVGGGIRAAVIRGWAVRCGLFGGGTFLGRAEADRFRIV